MGDFDNLKLSVEALSGGKNTVILDDLGMPSIFVVRAKTYMDELIAGQSHTPHPAFITNDVEKSAIYISKYQNIVQNGRAYSLPFKDCTVNVSYDQANTYCDAKGPGFHLVTRAEWAFLALLAIKKGTIPHGNNNYGSDSLFPYEHGVEASNDGTKTNKTLTGSGPNTWSDDWSTEGIYDLGGNVSEWMKGLKTVDGIAKIMKNNNYTDAEANWIDTATNIMTGRTSGQPIATMLSGVIGSSGMKWDGLLIPATTGSGAYNGDNYWINAVGEMMACCFGNWGFGAFDGVSSLYLLNARSYAYGSLGFRCAFQK